jgi:hypothetical protein
VAEARDLKVTLRVEDKSTPAFYAMSRALAPDYVIEALQEWLATETAHTNYSKVHEWVYSDEATDTYTGTELDPGSQHYEQMQQNLEHPDEPDAFVQARRWELYWKSWRHQVPVAAQPADQHTLERREDFQLWLEKVLADPYWYIAPGVTDAMRCEAHLPTPASTN